MSTIVTDKQKMRDYALKLRRYFAGSSPPEARWAVDLQLAERWIDLIDSPRWLRRPSNLCSLIWMMSSAIRELPRTNSRS
jgi:hypothetical protein